jgi:hypothetical protein
VTVSLAAGRAHAVDEEFMAHILEASRQLRLKLNGAALQLMQSAACIALEVMMMLFSGNFVASGVTRNLDTREPFFLNQHVDVPVDRRNTQRLHLLLRKNESFIRRQRPVGNYKGRADRFFLTGVSRLNDS